MTTLRVHREKIEELVSVLDRRANSLMPDDSWAWQRELFDYGLRLGFAVEHEGRQHAVVLAHPGCGAVRWVSWLPAWGLNVRAKAVPAFVASEEQALEAIERVVARLSHAAQKEPTKR